DFQRTPLGAFAEAFAALVELAPAHALLREFDQVSEAVGAGDIERDRRHQTSPPRTCAQPPLRSMSRTSSGIDVGNCTVAVPSKRVCSNAPRRANTMPTQRWTARTMFGSG